MRIAMPTLYIQEQGAITEVVSFFEHIVREGALLIMDGFAYENLQTQVVRSFENNSIPYSVEVLQGECCKENIDQFIEKLRIQGAKCVIGIGGGKVLDVAKAVGHFGNVGMIMIPTSASTDGPCSQLSVLYKADGTFDRYIHLNKNPDGVLVDTKIIANAPVRLLKAGIGDALSTYFETEAGIAGQIEREGKSSISHTASALSKQCIDVLLNEGYKATQAVERKEVDSHLEAVVETIIYLSCVGFENGSLAAAHSVCNGLSMNTKYNHWMHGEKVAFGTIVQMILEKQPCETVAQIRDFCRLIGLPYKLEDLGVTQEELDELVENICDMDQPIHHMRQVFVDKDLVKSALCFTERL